MKHFSRTWKGSKKPGKQRKYRANSPLHTKQKFAHSHLSRELAKKYGKRSASLRKGDKVKIMRGQFKKHEGKIEKINLTSTRVFVSGAELTKKDGTKKILPVNPSNLVVTELNMEDKLRQKILERK